LTNGPAAMLQRVAPGRGGRVDEGHTTERPEHDPVCHSSDLPTGQGVTELVHEHNQKEQQVLHHVPGERGVISRPAIDFEDGYEKPRPMQKYIHPREAEQVERSLARIRHLREL
jgi:hypothetical protein